MYSPQYSSLPRRACDALIVDMIFASVGSIMAASRPAWMAMERKVEFMTVLFGSPYEIFSFIDLLKRLVSWGMLVLTPH